VHRYCSNSYSVPEIGSLWLSDTRNFQDRILAS